ncbi:MAG TPA: DUF2007 domain-containing protein [Xanthomonadaceae bacterium]|nr:DUF2007 domain-containing protein [Xanthomonadaceae bacterium]
MDTDRVLVASFVDAVQAHIACGRLRAEQIDASVSDEHFVTANWQLSTALGGVKLWVPAAQAGQAREVLQALERGAYAIDTDWGQCPYCGSVRVAPAAREDRRLGFASVLLLDLPLPYRRHLRCQDCGERWPQGRGDARRV